VTLLTELGVPFIKLVAAVSMTSLTWMPGWMTINPRARRAGKGKTLWPVKLESTGERILASGGLAPSYQTANAYAKALGLKTDQPPKRISRS